MVGRSRVAAYPEVPITGARNACTGCRLVRHRRAPRASKRRVIQCDHVLLIQRSGPKLTHRSEEHTSELQSQSNLVCRLLLEKKKTQARVSPRATLSTAAQYT